LRQAATLLFYGVVAVICFLAIRGALQPGGFGAIGPAFVAMRPVGLALSALSVAGFFAALWILEQCALRDSGAAPQARGRLIAPLAANALSIGVGFGALSGSALRLRLYAGAQMTGSIAIYVAASVTIMSVLGGCLVAALGCVFGQLRLPSLPAGFTTAAPWIGGMMLVGLAALVFCAGPSGRKITLFARHFDLPSSRGLALQISVGALSWFCSVLALYVLLPQAARQPLAEFTTSFVVFELIALTTGAPGGLGVFEAMILSLSNGQIPPERMAAALICYRMISFVAPVALGLAGGAALIALDRRRHPMKR
jgi:phosphatidylglycerol lysyltransferase